MKVKQMTSLKIAALVVVKSFCGLLRMVAQLQIFSGVYHTFNYIENTDFLDTQYLKNAMFKLLEN